MYTIYVHTIIYISTLQLSTVVVGGGDTSQGVLVSVECLAELVGLVQLCGELGLLAKAASIDLTAFLTEAVGVFSELPQLLLVQ